MSDVTDLHYGSPMVTDPRDFTPDEQMCAPHEIEAWKEACRRAEAGEHVEIPQSRFIYDKDGRLVAHILNQPWGIGISTTRTTNPWPRLLTELRVRMGEPGPPVPRSQLAKTLGINRLTIYRWERGRTRPNGKIGDRLGRLMTEYGVGHDGSRED